MAQYVYVALTTKTNKIDFGFGVSNDPGDVFRAISEYGEWGKYNVGKFALTEPNKILPYKKSDYHCEE